MRFLKRVQESTEASRQQLSHEWSTFRSRFPALAEYLEVDSWDDGKTRLTSTLLVFVEDGSVKGCLNDREADRALWVTAGSIQGVIEALEAALAAGTGDWRARTNGSNRRNGKKSKN